MFHQQISNNLNQINMSDENQKNNLKFEPFLLNRRCCFKEFFVLTDNTFNGSMIEPVKLAIPKKPKQPSQANSKLNKPKENMNKNLNENPQISKDENISKNLNENQNVNQNVNLKDNDNHIINPPQNKPQMMKDNQNQNISSQNSDILSDDKNTPEINNSNYRNSNLENKSIKLSKQNILDPVPLGSISVFHMKVDKKNPLSVVPVENPNETICNITKEIKKRSIEFKITMNNNIIANVTMASHDSFYSTSNINGKQYEISAQTIQKQSKELKIRQFQAFFPPKEQPINFNGSSVLLKNSINRIEMGPRPPKLKRGIPVMYFGGRVKKESVQNFILETHDDECAHFVFGKVDDETFVGEVYPPLSPLQAITIALPLFCLK